MGEGFVKMLGGVNQCGYGSAMCVGAALGAVNQCGQVEAGLGKVGCGHSWIGGLGKYRLVQMRSGELLRDRKVEARHGLLWMVMRVRQGRSGYSTTLLGVAGKAGLSPKCPGCA